MDRFNTGFARSEQGCTQVYTKCTLSVNQNRPPLAPIAISEHFEHFLGKMKKNKFSSGKKKHFNKKSVNL